jgi:non-heme chloroperoxidase
VLSLVLVGSATTWRGNPVIEELWADEISTLSDPVDPAFVRAFQESPRLSPERLDSIVAESLKMPARVWREVWREIMATDFSADLRQIQAPTMIVWGDEDPLCSRSEQEALLATIADAKLVVYPGCGHNLHWEEPERFAGDLVAFTGGLSVRASQTRPGSRSFTTSRTAAPAFRP